MGSSHVYVQINLNALWYSEIVAYLREGTVVPEVTFVWEAVTNETKFAFLDVLLDGVKGFLLGDLSNGC